MANVAKIAYKDGTDVTQVYCGLKMIGLIERVEGGWRYRGKGEVESRCPLMPSRVLVKRSLRFRKQDGGESAEPKLDVS